MVSRLTVNILLAMVGTIAVLAPDILLQLTDASIEWRPSLKFIFLVWIVCFFLLSAKQTKIALFIFGLLTVIELIQVCENLMDKKTRNREIRSLVHASSELKSVNLRIITSDEDEMIKQNGLSIKVIPVIQWLIES